jgi:hypothetical protein
MEPACPLSSSIPGSPRLHKASSRSVSPMNGSTKRWRRATSPTAKATPTTCQIVTRRTDEQPDSTIAGVGDRLLPGRRGHRGVVLRPLIAPHRRLAIDSFTSPLRIPMCVPPHSSASTEAIRTRGLPTPGHLYPHGAGRPKYGSLSLLRNAVVGRRASDQGCVVPQALNLHLATGCSWVRTAWWSGGLERSASCSQRPPGRSRSR